MTWNANRAAAFLLSPPSMIFGRVLFNIVVHFSFIFSTVHGRTAQATWYNTGLGSCGFWNINNEPVVALNPIDYAGGTRCGKYVSLNYQGKSARAKIVDLCPSCGLTGIDLSPAAFQALAPLATGQMNIDWDYV